VGFEPHRNKRSGGWQESETGWREIKSKIRQNLGVEKK
jgi:hypothetical protein